MNMMETFESILHANISDVPNEVIITCYITLVNLAVLSTVR